MKRNLNPFHFNIINKNKVLIKKTRKMKKKLFIAFLVVTACSVLVVTASEKKDIAKFRVENMTCGGCAGKIKKTVTAYEGVSEFSADLEKRVVTIVYDSEKVNEEDIKASIAEIKYTPADYDPNEVIARTVSFKAEQIGCGGCANKVKKNIGAENGVQEVDVDLTTKAVKVVYDANKTTAAELKDDFQKFNYTVTKYWENEKVNYARFDIEQIGSKSEELEQNLKDVKGIIDFTINDKTNTIAVAYNNAVVTEEAIAENIQKANPTLVLLLNK